VPATNLLVLLACKQYLAQPNVLTKFTSRTRAPRSMPAPRTTNRLLHSRSKQQQQQRQHINPLGLPRVVRHVLLENHALVSQPTQYPSPTIFGHTGAARERERSLSRVREPMGIEEGEEYTYTHAYTRACNFCHPRVAGCKQKIRRSCVASTYEGFTTQAYSSFVYVPLGACRGFSAVELFLHAGSAIESCTTFVIYAPLEYTWGTGDFCHIGSGHNIMLCIRGQTMRGFVSPNRR